MDPNWMEPLESGSHRVAREMFLHRIGSGRRYYLLFLPESRFRRQDVCVSCCRVPSYSERSSGIARKACPNPLKHTPWRSVVAMSWLLQFQTIS